ncbi:hypothetical protein [Halomonas sp. SpR8]|nr:hypothetical protein [Halomonas sp. SpR8]MDQ7727885.1 hypothetical protein [Halomonas sp. SpR8]
MLKEHPQQGDQDTYPQPERLHLDSDEATGYPITPLPVLSIVR